MLYGLWVNLWGSANLISQWEIQDKEVSIALEKVNGNNMKYNKLDFQKNTLKNSFN